MDKYIPLFRAVKTGTLEWVYGLPLYGNHDNEITEFQTMKTLSGKDKYGNMIFNNDDEIVRIEKQTIGQFIGRLDKNRDTIFDGDIIMGRNCDSLVVCLVYIHFGSKGYTPACKEIHREEFGLEKHAPENLLFGECIILGDKYTTPEMLEKEFYL